MKLNQRGFTIIELMIVLAIIGVLSAIAIPAYEEYVIRAQVSEGLTMAEELKADIQEYYVARGSMPANNTVANISPASSLTGNYVTGIGVSGGQITITYGNKANSKIAGDIVMLHPFKSASDDIVWRCGRGSVPATASNSLPGANASIAIPATHVESDYLASDCRM